jgi:hypothetical protein
MQLRRFWMDYEQTGSNRITYCLPTLLELSGFVLQYGVFRIPLGVV